MSKTRVAPKSDIVAELLVHTRRRCCLCVYLNGDPDRKRVQIAHIDRNSSNSSERNLVPLCLDHHDEYDSRTSQSKGLQPEELSTYKQSLLDDIASGKFHFGPRPIAPQFLNELNENDAFAYGMLFSDVSRIVATYDPVGLVAPGHEDEYDLEIDDILFVIRNSNPSNHEEELRDVFAHWFDEDIADSFDNYAAMAHDIRNAIVFNQLRNPIYNSIDRR